MLYIAILILVLALGYFIIDSRVAAHKPRKGRDHCMKLPVAHVVQYDDHHMHYVGETERDGVEYRLWAEEVVD